MKITHRASVDASPSLPADAEQPLVAPSFDKAPRLSCCCRLSELLPKVREVHDALRAARLATEQPGVAA